MSQRTFIRGLVSGTKSSGPKESTSIDSEDSSSESGNPSKAHSPESNEVPTGLPKKCSMSSYHASLAQQSDRKACRYRDSGNGSGEAL